MNPNPRFLEMARKWANDLPHSKADGDPLVALIAGGESETVEFKTRLPPDDIVAKHLVAFANVKGGVLLIGVGDDGKAIGLTNGEVAVTIKRLQRIAERLLSYPVEIGVVDVAGSTVVYAALDAAPSELRPITTS
jgi:predicted HTH transcriptional regulator